VDQIAQYRERPAFRRFQSQRNGVPDAKAHSQVFRAYDFHIQRFLN